jgi:ferredoxin--NADP+ reductase
MANDYWVAVIGAGPAGIFAARELALQNINVVLINRDIKPGGLAEYGIYPDKHNMKEGLRFQFRKILAMDKIHYFGNLRVGLKGDLTLEELHACGFQAILVTAGAQGTKWLGLQGELLEGVYHAKDLVYHYNKLPPFSQRKFLIGNRVAVIGAGNVSLDIVHFLTSQPKVDQAIAVIRRGPAEVKFDRRELEYVARTLDKDDLEAEIQRVSPIMAAVDQNPDDFRAFMSMALEKAAPLPTRARFLLRFLVSPTRILGDNEGRVCGLEVEDNTLVADNGEMKARSLGTKRILEVDTVVFAIGDRVDNDLGLPVHLNEFVKNPAPLYPVEGTSFEAFDPAAHQPLAGIFVAGWSREASRGLVGVARRDGTMAAHAVLQFLETQAPVEDSPLDRLRDRICVNGCFAITDQELAKLEAVEHLRATQLGLDEFKFSTNQEMLKAIGEYQ